MKSFWTTFFIQALSEQIVTTSRGLSYWVSGRNSQLALMVVTLILPKVAWSQDYTTVIDHGPPENRWDITVVGDGYTESQLNRFGTHVRSFARHMSRDEVYGRYWNFFNIHRIDVVSNESGADIPPQGIFRDTALGATYFGDGVTERLLVVNDSLVAGVVARAYQGVRGIRDDVLISVNHELYGGAGGTYGTFSALNSSGNEVALHEMGHVLHQLADEYGGSGSNPGFEPGEVNVTSDPSGAKWSEWIGYNQPGIGVIGAYEGARYFDQGMYRPSENSKMRSLFQPFDAVSREKIVLDIYRVVDPLDDYLDNDETLINPETAWIDLVDPEVLDVEWFLDDVMVENDDEEVFDFSRHEIAEGVHTLTVRAYDPTDWVRRRREVLEESVSWTVDFFTPLAGDANYDRKVDLEDFEILKSNFGTGDSWTQGDFDDNAEVNLADFNLLKTNFGQSNAVPVAEPSSFGLAGLALVFGLVPLRRARPRSFPGGITTST